MLNYKSVKKDKKHIVFLINVIKIAITNFDDFHCSYGLCHILSRCAYIYGNVRMDKKAAYYAFELYQFKPSYYSDPEIGFFTFDEQGKMERLILLKEKILPYFELKLKKLQ